jgi:hypothetical protein
MLELKKSAKSFSDAADAIVALFYERAVPLQAQVIYRRTPGAVSRLLPPARV